MTVVETARAMVWMRGEIREYFEKADLREKFDEIKGTI
jgi:hypothetical protein